jgi:hypothetical protein
LMVLYIDGFEHAREGTSTNLLNELITCDRVICEPDPMRDRTYLRFWGTLEPC